MVERKSRRPEENCNLRVSSVIQSRFDVDFMRVKKAASSCRTHISTTLRWIGRFRIYSKAIDPYSMNAAIIVPMVIKLSWIFHPFLAKPISQLPVTWYWSIKWPLCTICLWCATLWPCYAYKFLLKITLEKLAFFAKQVILWYNR